jgi:hypothetical protein
MENINLEVLKNEISRIFDTQVKECTRFGPYSVRSVSSTPRSRTNAH